MKKFLLPALLLCFVLAACSKHQEQTENASAGTDVTGQEESEVLSYPDCKELNSRLSACIPFSCSAPFEFKGKTFQTVYTVKGVQNNKCIFAQNINFEGNEEELLHCSLEDSERDLLSDYYKKHFALSSSTPSENDTDNPINELIAKRVCSIPDDASSNSAEPQAENETAAADYNPEQYDNQGQDDDAAHIDNSALAQSEAQDAEAI